MNIFPLILLWHTDVWQNFECNNLILVNTKKQRNKFKN